MNQSDPQTFRIFDTTLRDGEQSPGVALSLSEKREIARLLASLRVDVIEAGFPASSREESDAVRHIAEDAGEGSSEVNEDGVPIVCALARTTEEDIRSAWDAVRFARRPRIHTFIATSDVHLRHKLRMSEREVLTQTERMVSLAHDLCRDVQFSAEDATRSDPGFLLDVVEAAVRAGATTINIPDTVGYATPGEFADLIRKVSARLEPYSSVVLSIHCHDDLGMATANTLAGLTAGARQAEVTINGIGERAGNAALEEVVLAARTRRTAYGFDSQIETQRIAHISRIVSHYTGMPVQPNKAIVGSNAFAHESGIHQDGILKHSTTYEIIRPEAVGYGESHLVLGKHSGRHAFADHLEKLGYTLSSRQLNAAFKRFKDLAGKRSHVSDEDLEAFVADLVHTPNDAYQLADLQVVSGREGLATATVRLVDPKGEDRIAVSIGAGPIDAVYRAIGEIVILDVRLDEFRIHAVTEGIDAQGAVSVRVSHGAGTARIGGYATDTDILVASAKAYLNALNRCIEARQRAHVPEASGTTPSPYKGEPHERSNAIHVA